MKSRLATGFFRVTTPKAPPTASAAKSHQQDVRHSDRADPQGPRGA